VTTDRSLYDLGEPIRLQVKFRNPSQAPADPEDLFVQLRGASGPSRPLPLQRHLGRRGIFTANIENLAYGEYEALLVRPTQSGPSEVARFAIRQPPQELADVQVNREGLSRAAKISGGKSYALTDIAQWTQELPPPRRQTFAKYPPRPLWNHPAIVALFVLVLSSEWMLRRHYGMP